MVEFKLNERARMCGFVIVGPSDPDNVLELAWDNIEPLATLAGLQAEQEFLPGLIDSAFFLDGDRWQLGWWTDGERVMESTWFQQNPPDSAGVLGHPPLHKPDRGTTTDT